MQDCGLPLVLLCALGFCTALIYDELYIELKSKLLQDRNKYIINIKNE